jgi:hypothetical protein
VIDPISQHKTSTSEARRTPELLGRHEVVAVPEEPGKYRFSCTAAIEGELTLLLECDAKDFPFDRYCRFVRHPGQNHPYTFSSLEFHPYPPGIRLGPWPGWRGILEFPVVSASIGAFRTNLQPTFWGDESTSGILRMLGRLPDHCDGVVTFTSSDSQIVPRRVSIYPTNTLHARGFPTRLKPELEGVHPRLLITPGVLSLLHHRAVGSHRALWGNLLSVWENRLLPFEKTAESKCVSGPERLSGQDRVLISALIALVTEKNDDVRHALEAYRGYVDETGRPDYEPLGIDTQAGEALFILSVGYDWLYSWISEPEKSRAAGRLKQVAHICASYLTPERMDYGQAHYLGCGLGLVAYSLLGLEGEPDSSNRLAGLRGALECSLELLSDDGSYPHGINLWIYEFGFLLRWIELFRACSGDDIWQSKGEGLGLASAFRVATLSGGANQGITFGDPQYRVGGDSWCHFLIASRTGSSLAQWAGQRLLDQSHEGVDFRNMPARRRVYEFLFFDPEIAGNPLGPGVQTFADIGQVTFRSPGTLFAMRSGPPLGCKRYAAGEYGAYGHSDPANGSFLLEHNGHMIASGPGPVYRRDTSMHNVVTIDGKGQIGDSAVWLPDFFPPEVLPPCLEIDTDGLSATLFADLAKAYLPHLGVERYTRAVFVNPERIVLGVDVVTCNAVRSIEWNIHSRFPFTSVIGDRAMVFDLGSDVRLALLSPREVSWETGLMDFIPAYPNDGTRDYQLTARVKSAAERFIWCYLLASTSLPRISKETNGTFEVEVANGETLVFDGFRFRFRGNS